MTGGPDPFWRVADVAAFIAALDRELADRQRLHADKVRKGAMHETEAAHVTGLIQDLRGDLLHYFAPVPEDELQRPPRDDPAFSWTAKVTWIRAEHAELEAKAGELVSKGRMTLDDAQRLRAMFGTLHRLYWRGMFMWTPPEGPAADYLRAIGAEARGGNRGTIVGARNDGEGARLYRQLVRDHMAALEAECGDGQGRLVA